MMTRKTRIARTAAVIFAAAVAVFIGVMPATADINTSSVKVTDPTQSEVIAGSYDSDGTPSGFKFTFKGQATTTCSSGWQTIKFTVTGPSGSQFFNVAAPSTETWNGSAPTQWDTQPLENGTYTVRLDVVEKDTTSLVVQRTGCESLRDRQGRQPGRGAGMVFRPRPRHRTALRA